MVVLQLQMPFPERLRIPDNDKCKGVGADVAVRLVEELMRQRDMILIDKSNLRNFRRIGFAFVRA